MHFVKYCCSKSFRVISTARLLSFMCWLSLCKAVSLSHVSVTRVQRTEEIKKSKDFQFLCECMPLVVWEYFLNEKERKRNKERERKRNDERERKRQNKMKIKIKREREKNWREERERERNGIIAIKRERERENCPPILTNQISGSEKCPLKFFLAYHVFPQNSFFLIYGNATFLCCLLCCFWRGGNWRQLHLSSSIYFKKSVFFFISNKPI